MKKPYNVLAVMLLAGAVFSPSIPSAFAEKLPATSENEDTSVPEEEMSEQPEELPPLDTGIGFTPFQDTNGTIYANAVWFLYINGIVKGVSETRFGVTEPIKRVDAAVTLGNYMAIDYTIPAPPKSAFKDLPARAVRIVSALKAEGIMNGKTDTYFGADLKITRGEAAIMLYNAFGKEIKVSDSVLKFTDVANRYSEPVRLLTAAGIIQGKTTTKFGTNDPLTRGQLALLMYRIYQYQQGNLEIPAGPVADEKKSRFIAFGDSNTSGSYFEEQYPKYQYNKWTDQVAAEYSKGMSTDIYNAGISGDETNEGMARFKKEVLDLNPSAVSIMFGLNDALLLPNGQPQVSKAQFEQNLTSMVIQLKEKNIKILLMTNPPVNEELYYSFYSSKNLKQLYASKGGIHQWTNSYNDIIRKIAEDQKVQLIDNYENAIAKAGGKTDSAISKSGLVDDLIGIHWSPKGNSMIAYSVKYYLSK